MKFIEKILHEATSLEEKQIFFSYVSRWLDGEGMSERQQLVNLIFSSPYSNQYKTSKKNMYRGIGLSPQQLENLKKKEFVLNNREMSSWTTNIGVAKFFAQESKYGMGIVLSKSIPSHHISIEAMKRDKDFKSGKIKCDWLEENDAFEILVKDTPDLLTLDSYKVFKTNYFNKHF